MSQLIELNQNYREEFSASDKFFTLRVIQQDWLRKLTPSEYMVLMFIWSRTIYWGKEKEFIFYRHFLKGIPRVISALPFKKARLSQILKSLEEKNFVIRERIPSGSFYKLSFSSNE